MMKEALQYLIGLGQANIHEVTLPDGSIQKYSDKKLERIDKYIPLASEIEMSTLTSLVDYIKSGADAMSEKMIVHVESPERVRLYSNLNDNREREMLTVVNAQLPKFDFNSFMDHERFNINVQSKFINDSATDKALILKFSGSVEQGSVAQYGDDGVTQKATVKTGITNRTDAVVPNPVSLKPYRTFIEVDQPSSRFIFRMREGKIGGIECALFEADGGAWMNEAMYNIKKYLEEELKDLSGFIIIS